MSNNIIKKGNKYFCAFCNVELNEDTLMYSQEAVNIYRLSIDRADHINYEQVDVYSDDCGEVLCGECGAILFEYNEKLVKKILKS
jgi:hypothetical protein